MQTLEIRRKLDVFSSTGAFKYSGSMIKLWKGTAWSLTFGEVWYRMWNQELLFQKVFLKIIEMSF